MRYVLLCGLMASGCALPEWDPVIDEDGGRGRDAGSLLDAGPESDAGPRDAAPDAGGEICDNGLDDDGDGDADCADSDCEEVACIQGPEGWSPPGRLVESGDAEPACPRGEALIAGWSSLQPEPAECAACTCGDPTGGACDSVRVRGYDGNGCGGISSTLDVSRGMCEPSPTPIRSVLSITADYTASCEDASGGGVSGRPEPARGGGLALCGSSAAAGCLSLETCAPTPLDDAPLCVAREGEHGCPDGFPVSRRIFSSTGQDTRDCSACSCAARADGCDGAVRFHTGFACLLGSESVEASSIGCQTLNNTASAVRFDSALTPINPRCAPVGGGPTGCVAPGATTTVCCQTSSARAVGCPSGPGPAMHHVEVDATRSFCIDVHEVTNAHYRAFLDDGGPPTSHARCGGDPDNEPNSWPADANEDNQPVTRVDFCDAAAYCEWAGKRLCGAIDRATTIDVEAAEDPALSEWNHICSRGAGDCGGGNEVEDVLGDACCRAELVYDLSGNAREWVDACEGNQCAIHRDDSCDDVTDRDVDDREGRLGFRCCADAI